MAMVKVWNDNTHPYSEEFRGRMITIPAKKFVEMDAGDAHLFKGSFNGMMVDGDGQPDPRGFKMLRIEEGAEVIEMPKVNELICQACRYEGSNKQDLADHIKASHSEIAAVDEEAEAEIKRRAGRPRKAQ